MDPDPFSGDRLRLHTPIMSLESSVHDFSVEAVVLFRSVPLDVAPPSRRCWEARCDCRRCLRFEDDPLAVEVYDLQSRQWTKSDPMPEIFNQSASSMWLSVASDDRRLFVMEKTPVYTYSFNTNNNNWSGPYDLRPDQHVFYSVIRFSNPRLIVIGMLGEPEDVDCDWDVWGVNCNYSECKEIREIYEGYKGD
ncbi:hypothetical protein L1987_04809 [Smallanthus sonchifolius]|uniref:Uncharacterized protein n=1 Tax=Smallanthus sonchifolius TaxID=185202 RepID=A0ACB9JTL9_9ASTR|nr:hypothetical protein L1987_04809 [Smallanthus sonchifolius]